MFLNLPLAIVDILLILVNVFFAIRSFYDKKRPLRINRLEVIVDLSLSACFMLMLSHNLLVDALGMILGLIFQVLQIGNDHLRDS